MTSCALSPGLRSVLLRFICKCGKTEKRKIPLPGKTIKKNESDYFSWALGMKKKKGLEGEEV